MKVEIMGDPGIERGDDRDPWWRSKGGLERFGPFSSPTHKKKVNSSLNNSLNRCKETFTVRYLCLKDSAKQV